jgi:hypothetical protein
LFWISWEKGLISLLPLLERRAAGTAAPAAQARARRAVLVLLLRLGRGTAAESAGLRGTVLPVIHLPVLIENVREHLFHLVRIRIGNPVRLHHGDPLRICVDGLDYVFDFVHQVAAGTHNDRGRALIRYGDNSIALLDALVLRIGSIVATLVPAAKGPAPSAEESPETATTTKG